MWRLSNPRGKYQLPLSCQVGWSSILRLRTFFINILIDGKMITDKTDILNMWADHFETLGTPSDNITYDKSFFQKVSSRVEELFSINIFFQGILKEH